MSSPCLMPLVLWACLGPGGEPLPAAPVPSVLQRYREEVRGALSASSQARNADPELVADGLLNLFEKLDQTRELPHVERRKMQLQVRARLLELADRLERRMQHVSPPPKAAPSKAAPHKVTPQKVAAQQLGNTATTTGGSNAGGAAAAIRGLRGLELVELIRDTVAPETWDIRGGKGTAMYFDPVLGLVVRQSHTVQDDVGSAVQQLRK